MEAKQKNRIQSFLSQINEICTNLLNNLFTLGNDLNTKTIMSIAYSPIHDIVYVYCADTYTGHILKQELEKQFQSGYVRYETINSDIIGNRYVIEIEFRHKEVIEQNKSEGKEKISLLTDERYL